MKTIRSTKVTWIEATHFVSETCDSEHVSPKFPPLLMCVPLWKAPTSLPIFWGRFSGDTIFRGHTTLSKRTKFDVCPPPC